MLSVGMLTKHVEIESALKSQVASHAQLAERIQEQNQLFGSIQEELKESAAANAIKVLLCWHFLYLFTPTFR